MMGMSVDDGKKEKSLQKKEKEKQTGEVKALRLVSATENADIKRALTAVLLIAQIAMTKAQGNDDTGFYDLGSLDFIVIWVVIPMIVALIAILSMHHMNLSELKRRSSLMDQEVERRVQERVQQFESQLLSRPDRSGSNLRSRGRASAASNPAGSSERVQSPETHAPPSNAAAPSAADGSAAAGAAAGSISAGSAAAGSISAGSAAAGVAAENLAAAAVHLTSIAGGAADRLTSTAGGDAQAAVSERARRPVGMNVGSSNDLPRLSFHPDAVPLFVTPSGTKYHYKRSCYGLRNAFSIIQVPRCPHCGPVQIRPQGRLYRGNAGNMHTQHWHAASCDGFPKEYELCRACNE